MEEKEELVSMEEVKVDIVEYEGAFAGDRFGARKHFEETLSHREFVVKG